MAGTDALAALDSTHSRAICDEIGERLRDALGRQVAEMPLHLRRLVDRLAELDHVPAPSIVPAIDDIRNGAAGHAAGRRETEPA